MFDESLLQQLVWTDYRLAIFLTVSLPLVLLIWAFVQKVEAMQRLLVIYWRVASLLAITVYLAIASLPISFITGFMARLLIPASLWFWVDINDEIEDRPPSPLKWTMTAWRWAVTLYCIIGAIFQAYSLRCAALTTDALVNDFACRVWLEAPWGYKAMFHPNGSPQILGFFAIVGLAVYVICLLYFCFVRLGKQGRSALG
ncbi:hypothetical protein AY599_16635 [Leptolyngbya valderiana BDU 20041]|nr:DUF3177 family protein [Geitlerinema sp. CS-897]OAB63342.1 hypothetical protein AY599_16635 [Leptolyngbya valderiana BDU 20041]